MLIAVGVDGELTAVTILESLNGCSFGRGLRRDRERVGVETRFGGLQMAYVVGTLVKERTSEKVTVTLGTVGLIGRDSNGSTLANANSWRRGEISTNDVERALPTCAVLFQGNLLQRIIVPLNKDARVVVALDPLNITNTYRCRGEIGGGRKGVGILLLDRSRGRRRLQVLRHSLVLPRPEQDIFSLEIEHGDPGLGKVDD
ncbi:hypothetical protein BC834DRAFT_897049 [Gloeopeniophorella convolvens]|nr:hypothetical protein BC834DRAFT_897049 [Gloeopeniophorella convolvens]